MSTDPGASRHTERKERTRKALLKATRQLVLERGHQKTSIKQITDQANVGLGTFYNYFETKQHAFEAVLEEMRDAFQARLEAVRAPLKDPATLVAVTTGYALRESIENEEWHLFISRAGLQAEQVLLQSPSQRLEDLAWGARTGRFCIDDVEFSAQLIEGMLQHVVAGTRSGTFSESAIADTLRTLMRMFGLPDVVAGALAQSPLPPVPSSARPALPPIAAERHAPVEPAVASSEVVRLPNSGLVG